MCRAFPWLGNAVTETTGAYKQQSYQDKEKIKEVEIVKTDAAAGG